MAVCPAADEERAPCSANEAAAPLLAPHTPDHALDWLGRPAHARLGGWKAAFCVLGMLSFYALSFSGILFNLVIFLVEVGFSNSTAAAIVAALTGTQYLSSFLGAVLSDGYIGRLWALLIFQSISTLSYILVAIFITVLPSSGPATTFLLASICILVITTGPVLPVLIGLGMDQLKSSEEKEKYFWLVAIAIAIGQLLASTVVAYIDNKGMWVWGFWSCAIAALVCLALGAGGLVWFRHHWAFGNPFLRNCQVVVAALRKCRLSLPEDLALLHESGNGDMSTIPGCPKVPHTFTLSFLDKAAVVEVGDKVSCWRLCTVTQVEELKSLLRVFPAGISVLFLVTGITQISTLFEEQAILMNRYLGGWFVLSPAALNVFSIASSIITGIIRTTGLARLSRGHCFGCIAQRRTTQRATTLQWIGISLALSIIAMVISALVELYRRSAAKRGVMVSVMWLVPQTIILGVAENLGAASFLEFFFSETSDSMRSVGGSIAIMFGGVGSYMNTVLLGLIKAITTHGGQPGWIADNLNEGHADYFYWLLAGCSAVSLGFHIVYARSYKYSGLASWRA